MRTNQINNTNFKQVFMPGYGHYTDKQKAIGDYISDKINIAEEQPGAFPYSKGRPDFVLSTLGKKDSLTLFSCFKSFDYKDFTETYADTLYIGEYKTGENFAIEDVNKANKKPLLNKVKAAGIVFMSTALGLLGITKRKRFLKHSF